MSVNFNLQYTREVCPENLKVNLQKIFKNSHMSYYTSNIKAL